MALKLIAGPGSEPISVDELKMNARIDSSTEDALLTILIQAAREKAEAITGTALISQTWELLLDAFPEAEIDLEKPPVASITHVKYIDPDGDEQTLSSTLYSLDNATLPGWLLPAVDTEWPDTQEQANAVTVRFVTGYANAAAVPAQIKAWLLLTASFLYANREAFVSDGRIAEIPNRFVDSLLDPYRVFRI